MARRPLLLLLLAAAGLTVVRAAIASDEVKILPGWTGPLPSRMFSGFVSAGR